LVLSADGPEKITSNMKTIIQSTQVS